MNPSLTSVFFLSANGLARDMPNVQILDVFGLVHAFASSRANTVSAKDYQSSSQLALLRVPGLGPAKELRYSDEFPSQNAAILALLTRVPESKPSRQADFIASLDVHQSPEPRDEFLTLYCGSVTPATDTSVSISAVSFLFVHWIPDVALGDGGQLDVVQMSSVLNKEWFDSHQSEWIALTKHGNHSSVINSGRFLQLPA